MMARRRPKTTSAWGLLLALLLALLGGGRGADSDKARVVFSNQGGVDMEVFWRHPETREYLLLASIAHGAGHNIDTWKGHEFVVRAAGRGTPSAREEPNYVQREAAEKRFLLETGARNQVKFVPELSGGQQQQQQASNNGSDMQRSASLAEEEEAEEAEPAAEGAAAVLLLKNNAGTAVGVHWLDGPNAQYVTLTTIEDGLDANINTFVGHNLLVLQVNEEKGGTPLGSSSHSPNVHVWGDEVLRVEEDEDGEVVLVSESLTVKEAAAASSSSSTQQQKRKQKKQQPPKKQQRAAARAVAPGGEVTLEVVKEAIKSCEGEAACVADALYRPRVAFIQKRVQIEMTARDEVEEAYRDFACLHHQEVLPPKHESHTWVYDPLGIDGACDATAAADGNKKPLCTEQQQQHGEERKEVRVDHFFDAPGGNARIYLLHDFASDKECKELKRRALPNLANAAVTGDIAGDTVVSKARKAKSALVRPNLHSPSDPLAVLQRRIFAFVNEYGGGGYDKFDLGGQEPLNVIMYNTTGDEYRIHCDGYCDSSPFMPGGRAATMVVYCEEAARGGQTSFTNVDLMVKGKAGQAAFFHYRDPEGFMDAGWTRHGGCPVVEGTKWIATQWIRDGVSEQDPWYRFTPTGDREGGKRGFISSDPNY